MTYLPTLQFLRCITYKNALSCSVGRKLLLDINGNAKFIQGIPEVLIKFKLLCYSYNVNVKTQVGAQN